MFNGIFGRSSTQGEPPITWNALSSIDQINEIIEESRINPILIFKHSYSCGTSAMALDRLHRKWEKDEMSLLKTYFLDLLSNRDLSNQIATTFGIRHQSPQVLIIYGRNCIYDNSHMGISYPEIKSIISGLEIA